MYIYSYIYHIFMKYMGQFWYVGFLIGRRPDMNRNSGLKIYIYTCVYMYMYISCI